MAIGVSGPFSGLVNGLAGWSNHATGAGAFKLRYDDGDPVASMIWREMAGNVNYQLGQSRRLVWGDSFIGTAVGSTDPTYVNAGTDWGALAAIYAWTPALIVCSSARRGAGRPPRLHVRVRARKNGASASNAIVRVYSVATFSEVRDDWDGSNNPKRTSDLTVSSTAYPLDADEGWLPAGGVGNALTLDLAVHRRNLVHPAFGADLEVGIEVMTTHLVVAGRGAGGPGPLVAAVEVWEEVPAA